MYIFKAQYNESIDIGKVERDFVKIKQRWDPEKMFAKSQTSSTNRTYVDYQYTKKDNDTYLYDMSSFV